MSAVKKWHLLYLLGKQHREETNVPWKKTSDSGAGTAENLITREEFIRYGKSEFIRRV